MIKATTRTSLTNAIDFADLEEAMARGRRERSLALTSMIKSLLSGRHNRHGQAKENWSPDCPMPAS